MSKFVPISKSMRSMTFDERTNRTRPRGFSNVKPLIKSSTFATSAGLPSVGDVSLDDALYRRYFNSRPRAQSLSRGQSFRAIKAGLNAAFVPSQSGQGYVVVVDTFSTGAMVTHQFLQAGAKVICVLSSEELGGLLDLLPEGVHLDFAATIVKTPEMSLSELVAEIKSVGELTSCVVAGAETGVELADQLSEHMGLRTNGTLLSEARRNKYVMGETVRSAGIRAVKQLKATKWADIQAYLEAWQPEPFKVIVKPIDSAGSDGVTLCRSIEEARKAFGDIIGKTNVLGLVNECVLVQEYLEGQEYVIDMVSRDGEHKVVGVWAYDRRPANGAHFVAFGQRLLTVDDEHVTELVAYQRRVCTALGILNGPSHGEVKWFKGEPVLVEVGARCHGAEGLWTPVADAVYGYNQVGCTIAAYTDAEEYAKLPAEVSTRKAYGFLKFLISYESGVLEALVPEAVAEIKAMPSYLGHQFFVEDGADKGSVIQKTENCLSWAGCVKLAHPDLATLKDDVLRLEALEKAGLFKVRPVETSDVAVVVVDPFSTGACVAASFYEHSFKVIAVYSGNLEKYEKLKNLIPKDITLEFEAVLGFDDNIEALAFELNSLQLNIKQIVAGAETGVELADQLSEHMGLRTNGTLLSEARRNKYVMGETVRSAGIRAVKQLKATKWADIQAYLEAWQPEPFKVIVKPIDSAGSDGVTLCRSIEEARKAFGDIIGKTNVLGLVNECVLVQEYLEGQEYVIDMVSRDGEHKVVGVWAYDRRPANGAHFVAFGQRLLTVDDEHVTELVAYQRRVCTALGILNGPSHGEVKWFKGEPVLVEVGARCHGAEGLWTPVADAVYGYNQVGCTIAAYTDAEEYAKLPAEVSTRKAYGRLSFLVNYVAGTLQRYNAAALDEIRSFESFIALEMFVEKGSDVRLTKDCLSWGGVVKLAHESDDVLEREYERIRELERSGIFIVES